MNGPSYRPNNRAGRPRLDTDVRQRVEHQHGLTKLRKCVSAVTGNYVSVHRAANITRREEIVMGSDTSRTLKWNYPDITEVEPLGPDDSDLVADLHAVLKKHGVLSRFGITLLHTHFALDEDEVILEETDAVSRRQQMRPVKIASLAGAELTETSWSLETGMPVMRCTCQKDQGRHNHFETNARRRIDVEA